jgi:hypothetical protein
LCRGRAGECEDLAGGRGPLFFFAMAAMIPARLSRLACG